MQAMRCRGGGCAGSKKYPIIWPPQEYWCDDISESHNEQLRFAMRRCEGPPDATEVGAPAEDATEKKCEPMEGTRLEHQWNELDVCEVCKKTRKQVEDKFVDCFAGHHNFPIEPDWLKEQLVGEITTWYEEQACTVCGLRKLLMPLSHGGYGPHAHYNFIGGLPVMVGLGVARPDGSANPEWESEVQQQPSADGGGDDYDDYDAGDAMLEVDAGDIEFDAGGE